MGSDPQVRSSSRILRRLSRPGTGPRRRRDKWPWLILAAGTALTLIVFSLAHRREGDVKRREFVESALHRIDVVKTNFASPLEVFLSLPPFFESSHEVERNEFTTFVEGALKRHAAILRFQWLPLVNGAHRTEFEQEAQKDGQPGFQIREYRPDRGVVTARQRSQYLPVLFEEPPGPFIGVDLSTDPAVNEVLQQSIERQDLVASNRIRLAEFEGGAVAFYHPIVGVPSDDVSAVGCRGVVAVIVRIPPVMSLAFEGDFLEETNCVLSDDTPSEDERLLFESEPGAARQAARNGFFVSRTFSIADREWTIDLKARPDSVWLSRPISWIVLAGGLAFSVFASVVTLGLGTIAGLKKRVKAAVQLGQYRLEEKIGEGGMGQVYRASHAMLRRPTAVKLLRPEYSSATAIERFEREVQLTSQLVHPNTIVIFDYGRTPSGIFYYAMEYLDGIDLRGVVRLDRRLPEGRVIHILRQACGSLNEAHLAGMVHRDIKPPNIMVCRRGGVADVVKVLDFGLVKDAGGLDSRVTHANAITGTPLYMSPEAIEDASLVDARSDLYALGAVGYFLLTGVPVFEAQSPIQVLHNHVHTAPVSPSERCGRELSADLQNVILSCLEKEPARRPQSAAELSDVLAQCQAAETWDRQQAEDWWSRYAKNEARDTMHVDDDTPSPAVDMSVEVDLENRHV